MPMFLVTNRFDKNLNNKTIITDKKFPLSQIQSGDKTGMLWKSMPQNTENYRLDKQINKQTLSALLCANADASHRLSNFWKSAKLRATKTF